jgi:hypothetical protein
MLIVAASVVLAVATPAAADESFLPAPPMPPMIVRVVAAPDVPARLVSAIEHETDAVWRPTGIQFFWRHDTRETVATPMPSPYRPLQLRVEIGHDRHHPGEWKLPLGWIVFDDPVTPEREIHLSYENAVALLEKSDGVVGRTRTMPVLQRETLLSRALGRALAHELGHYLLASKAHTDRGLMMAVHSAVDLFGIERGDFGLSPPELRRVVARFTSIYMASRG